MKYLEFRNKTKDLPIISSSILGYLGDHEQSLRNQISGWKRRDLVVELKRGLYVLNENDRKFPLSRPFMANQLYAPSYVSTEYALMVYDLIPERVTDVTSISTKKTAEFINPFGTFVYRHLSPKCFAGFVEKKDENDLTYFMATPEKALVDLIYLDLSRFDCKSPDIFERSMRLQNLEELNIAKLVEFSKLFDSKKLVAIVGMLVGVIQDNAKRDAALKGKG